MHRRAHGERCSRRAREEIPGVAEKFRSMLVGVVGLSLLLRRFHLFFQGLLPRLGTLLRGAGFWIHLRLGENRARGEEADGENTHGEFSSHKISDGPILTRMAFGRAVILQSRFDARTSHYRGGSC
jgi:hypothetical protein